MDLNQGEGLVKSFVPLTAMGRVKYLPAEFIPQGAVKPAFDYIMEHEKVVALHPGRKIPLGGWAAYRNASFSIQRPDGSIILVNGEGKLGEGVTEIK